MLVSFSDGVPGPLARAAAGADARTVHDGLALAASLGRPRPGRDLWEALATIASGDLGAVRAVEPHLDALAILAQAGVTDIDGTWGVFAAEGSPDPLLATHEESGWRLSGTKPWCSLAAILDAALITSADEDGQRRLFAVRLRQPGVTPDESAWVARGLTEVASGPVHFADVEATEIGEPGWYLTRPGFAAGGIGVAACWYGGAVGIARTVFAHAAAKPNPFLSMHLGAIDELLQSSRLALLEATATPPTPILAKRVRATVARACEEIIGRSGHALGPAPLALDPAHTKRVADLQLYLRQHHAEKDQASLGDALAAGPVPW